MRHVSLCLVVPFVLAGGPSGIVGIDNIRGPTEPDTPRQTVPLTIRVEGVVTAADDGSPIAGASAGFRRCESESYFHCTWRTVARTTTDVHGHYSLSYSYVHRRHCGYLWQGLETTAEGFLTNIFSGFDDPHLTCTEELQTTNVQLERIPTQGGTAGPTRAASFSPERPSGVRGFGYV